MIYTRIEPDRPEIATAVGALAETIKAVGVITSYSIHYTKLYEASRVRPIIDPVRPLEQPHPVAPQPKPSRVAI